MDVVIPDPSELQLLHDDEIERLLALEAACVCLLAYSERCEPADSEQPAVQHAA